MNSYYATEIKPETFDVSTSFRALNQKEAGTYSSGSWHDYQPSCQIQINICSTQKSLPQ